MIKETLTNSWHLISQLRGRIFGYAETLKMTDILLPTYIMLGLFTFSWIVSVFISDVTMVDYLWGISFAVQSICYMISDREGKLPMEKLTFNVIIIAHSLRLAFYLIFREFRKPEDKRYAFLRSLLGRNFSWLSFFFIFLPQAGVNLIIGHVIYTFNKAHAEDINQTYYWAGIGLMIFGSVFQSLADIQLHNFRRINRYKPAVCDEGLWRLCRHPNYFGDTVFWFGAYLCNVSIGVYYTVFSPLTLMFAVLFVTGIPITEKFLLDSKGKLYSSYQKRVSAFIPWIFNRSKLSKERSHSDASTYETLLTHGITTNNVSLDNPPDANRYSGKKKNKKLWQKNSKNKSLYKKANKQVYVPAFNTRKQEFFRTLQ